MNVQFNRVLRGVTLSALAGLLLASLGGCNADLLTWSQNAKQQGIQQYSDRHYAEAAGCFRNAARQNPTDPAAEYWLALCYEQTQDYHQAIDAYKTALHLMPPAGTTYYDQQMHDVAFERLARVVSRNDPSGHEADLIAKAAADEKSSEQYRLLGRIFRYRGDPDGAMDNYRRSVQMNPENFVAQRELGLYLEHLNQAQDAATVLRDAYRLNQHDAAVNGALRRLGMVPGPALAAHDRPVPPVSPGALADPTLLNAPLPAAAHDGPSPDLAGPTD